MADLEALVLHADQPGQGHRHRAVAAEHLGSQHVGVDLCDPVECLVERAAPGPIAPRIAAPRIGGGRILAHLRHNANIFRRNTAVTPLHSEDRNTLRLAHLY